MLPLPAPLTRQLAVQGAAVILVLSLAWPWFAWQGTPLPWPQTALAIGSVAFVFATLSGQPWPWRIAHGALLPLAWYLYPLPA